MADEVRLGFDQAIVPMITSLLAKKAQRDLGFEVGFEWPDPTSSTMVVMPGRTLTKDENEALRNWLRKDLGAVLPKATVWDYILNESLD